MRKWSIQTWSLAGVVAVLALLSALGAATCHEMALAHAASRHVDTVYERLSRLEQSRTALYRGDGARGDGPAGLRLAHSGAMIDNAIEAERATLGGRQRAVAAQEQRARHTLRGHGL